MSNDSKMSRNPANSGSLAGTFQEILGKFLGSVDDMLPAIVVAYDRGTNLATVRPLIRLMKTDNTSLSRAEVASIPVLQIGGGGVVLSFPIAEGDMGWIKANDRDISLFLANMEEKPPGTTRKHSFSDAIFIPDQFRKWVLDPVDDDAAVLQTLDGTQKLAIHPDEIFLTSDAMIQIGTQGIFISGNSVSLGTINVIGDVVAGFGASSLLNHTHTYDQPTGGSIEAETSIPN